MTIRPEPEVDQVELLGDVYFVLGGGEFEVAAGHRHRLQRRLVVDREHLHQVSEVAHLIAGGRHPLVDLVDVGVLPGHLLHFAEQADHRPGRLAAAQREVVLAPRRDRLPAGAGDHLGRVARGRVGVREDLGLDRHRVPRPQPYEAFSSWPPNCLRMAESTLSPKSPSSREEKRSYRAAVRTGAGTPSSIAAIEVQRPSPESETRPSKSARSGDSRIAAAVRSSSQEPITLPRRQTSATSGRSRSYW